MIENLDLTSREEDLLRQALSSGQSEPVGQLFRRHGLRPFIWLGLTIAILIGLLVAEAVWYQWLTEGGGFIWVLLVVFALDALLYPFRARDEFREVAARNSLICKLYRSLESRDAPTPSVDRQPR